MFAESHPGPKYNKKGWACQDNAGCWSVDFVDVIAVADGHGSSDCFRSEIGSKTALQAAYLKTHEYCGCCDGEATLEKTEFRFSERFSETSINNFKYSILTEWRRLVKAHWNSGSHDGELRYADVSEKYKARYGSGDEAVVEKYLYNAYGTTLLIAIAIETQILLLQVGDGTCLIVRRDGEFWVPVPADEDNFLNVTTSLCEEDVYPKKFRNIIIERSIGSPTEPVAVFLSTDGVDDCYPVYKNDVHLSKLYTVIIENIINNGFDKTVDEIKKDLLPGMTAKGSQDDISLAFLIRSDIDVLKEAYANIDARYKSPANTVIAPMAVDATPKCGYGENLIVEN